MMHKTELESDTAENALSALSADRPQPVWMTLNDARERAFTGEVVFEVDPEVFAYLDGGVVYYAERVSDAPLGRRLLDAGVVDTDQLERGTVRVGDVDHLGRLFDRDPSVDRDAVLVVTEMSTESLISEMATNATATVRVTAYRHHPSGVHRWFVAPLDAAATRPLAAVAQLDSSVIDDLGSLDSGGPAELTIEWDDVEDAELPAADLPAIDDDVDLFDPFRPEEMIEFGGPESPESERPDGLDDDVIDLSLEMASFVDSPMDAVADDMRVADDADFEFRVEWPDGSQHEAMNGRTEQPLLDVPDDNSVEDSVVRSENGDVHFDMPTLDVADEDAAVDEVPDDVADAVRRAIAAIESAPVAPFDDLADVGGLVDVDTEHDTGLDTGLDVADPAPLPDPVADPVGDQGIEASTVTIELPTIEPSPAEPAAAAAAPEPAAATAAPEPAEPAAPFTGFAPPTMATSAEVMYAQPAAETAPVAETAPAVDTPPSADVSPSLPSPGVASVVFVDDAEPEDDSNDRSSALRRLIGGLRRKDH